MKRQWRNILAEWRTEMKKKGCFPKEIFPTLMQRLTVAIEPTLTDKLKSGFRTSGLHAVNREVLKKLPSAPVNRERESWYPERRADRHPGLIEELWCRRGRNVMPRRRLVEDATTGPVASTSTATVSVPNARLVASTSLIAYASPVSSTSTAPVSVAYASPMASTSTSPVSVAYASPVAST